MFSWRSPEASDLWERAGGHPLTITQDGKEVETMTIQRTDGSDGDPSFNPYGLPDSNNDGLFLFREHPKGDEQQEDKVLGKGRRLS